MLINIIDARRGLHEKCLELFSDKKIADQIYYKLCEGIDDCEEVPFTEEKGKWIYDDDPIVKGHCSICGWKSKWQESDVVGMNYCPNCGADMRETK